jgi:hypothetical protein
MPPTAADALALSRLRRFESMAASPCRYDKNSSGIILATPSLGSSESCKKTMTAIRVEDAPFNGGGRRTRLFNGLLATHGVLNCWIAAAQPRAQQSETRLKRIQ